MKARHLAWLMLLGAISARAADGESTRRHNWWLEVGGGVASVGTDREASGRGSEGGWSFDFAGGMRFGDHWLVGLDLGGAMTEPYDLYYGSQGRTLSRVFIVTDYNLRANGGWLLHAGAGFADFTDRVLTTGGEREGNGPGFEVGIGYAWHPGRGNFIVVRGIYEFGRIEASNSFESESFNYSVPRLAVSWQFRSGSPR